MKLLDVADWAILEHGAMQKRTELAALLALVVGARPRVVWEIGTASGGTLLAIARALEANDPPWWLVSIDQPGGPFSGGATIDPDELRAAVEMTSMRLAVIHGDSRTVELPSLRPDFVLIDGDHSEAGVRADWDRYAPLVNEGGLVAFHDILPHPAVTGVEVAPFWADLRRTETTLEIVDLTDLGPAGNQWGGIGVVFR